MIQIFFTVLIFQLTQQKKVIQNTRIDRVGSWKYITKFGAEIGTSEYLLKLSLLDQNLTNSPTAVRFHLYLDDNWDEVLQLPECERHRLAKLIKPLDIPPDGKPTVYQNTVNQQARRHMWYFVIEDCQNNLMELSKKHVGKPRDMRARFQAAIHITNTGGSEFTTEENGVGQIMLGLAFVNIVLLISTFVQIRKEYKHNDEWDTALIFLFSALLIESFHHATTLIHLWYYASNGVGVPALTVLGDISEILSAFIVTIILIMLSSGWSIEYQSLVKLDLILPLALVVGMWQMLIMGLAKITDDHHTKYHKYEGWQGYVITFFYTLQYAYFITSIVRTKFQNDNIKRFMIQLSIYGSLYLFSFPILFGVVHIVAPYVRQKVIVYGTQLIRLLAAGFLLRMFTSKKSTYYQISYKNKSFLDRSKFE